MRSAFAIVLLGVVLSISSAYAAVIDRIDVEPRDNEADIVVRFSNKIIYMRHGPQQEGKILRIFFNLTDPTAIESDLMQETFRAPQTEGMPTVTFVYPELINGMLVTFSEKTRYQVRPGSDERSLVITVPLRKPVETSKPVGLPAVVPVPVPVPALVPLPVVPGKDAAVPVPEAIPAIRSPALTADAATERANSLIDEARRALAKTDPAAAIGYLNDLLRLPANSQTEAAQALIGEAREKNGEFVKAKAEYELYLKLFPSGPNAVAIRKRLADLPKDEARLRAAPRPLPKEAGPSEWLFFSSISSYYYTGNTQIETLTPPPPGQIVAGRETLSLVDQRSLITSVNLNARRRDAFSDTRIVFRDTDNNNYLNPSRSYNRLYSAYVDHSDRKIGYYVRGGRQNPNGLGVLERFDGVQAGYNLNSDWRGNAVYGDAVEFGSPFKKTFFGGSIDFLPQTGRPGASVYMVDQTLDGHPNRRAVGAEVRYFDGRYSGFGLLDYDVLFKGLNIALLQGNYLSPSGTNYYVVADHRRAPSYGLPNALPAGLGLTLGQMISLQGVDVVREQAAAMTALSDMYSIGFTYPYSENWQLGADYRVSAISSTQPVKAVVPLAAIGICLGTIDPVNDTCVIDTTAQNGSGWGQVVTLQAIGTNLFVSSAVGVGNASYIATPTYTGWMGGLSYMLPFFENWRLDTNLRYYTQNGDTGEALKRFSPSLKLSYQWRNSLFVEGEVGMENSTTKGPLRDDKTNRQYMYLGLRWDYR
jgi:hypothetical protein